MRSLTFRLQVVTPLFLSGADQQEVEPRPPSIRGALRFWFRAMMGGVVGGRWDEVRKLESLIWGDTKQASRVRIRVRGDIKIDHTERLNLKPGAHYLLYSPFLPKEKGSKEKQRPKFIAPGSEIDLSLTSEDGRVLDITVASLWLMVWLGALGMRSRRGAGILKFGEGASYQWRHDWDKEALCFESPFSQKDAVEKLGGGLQIIEEIFRLFAQEDGYQTGSPSDSPSFNLISRKYFILGVVRPKDKDSWEEWGDALDSCGTIYQAWRRNLPLKERTYLGLPLLGSKERRASPFWLRPIQLDDGRYNLLVELFQAKHTAQDPLVSKVVIKFLKKLGEELQVDWVNPYGLEA